MAGSVRPPSDETRDSKTLDSRRDAVVTALRVLGEDTVSSGHG